MWWCVCGEGEEGKGLRADIVRLWQCLGASGTGTTPASRPHRSWKAAELPQSGWPWGVRSQSPTASPSAAMTHGWPLATCSNLHTQLPADLPFTVPVSHPGRGLLLDQLPFCSGQLASTSLNLISFPKFRGQEGKHRFGSLVCGQYL